MPSKTPSAAKGSIVNQSTVPTASLLRRYNESKGWKQKEYETQWDTNVKYYKGLSSGLTQTASYQSDPRYNKTFEFVETMRGFASDNKWGLDVIPARLPDELQAGVNQGDLRRVSSAIGHTGPQDANTVSAALKQSLLDQSVKVNKLLDFLWMDNRMQGKLAQALLHVFTKGTAIIKATFDPNDIGDSGVGQIETTVVDPFYIYPDPDASCVQDASFIIEAHPVTVRWVLERYPDQGAEFLKSMGGASFNRAPYGTEGWSPSNQTEAKRVDILECWYKDSSVDEDNLDNNGQPALKYPNGRYTLMSSSGFVLEDKECQYHGWPYARIVEIPLPGEFFGGCTLDKANSIQELINKTTRTIIDNSDYMSHGIWVGDTTCGVTPEDLQDYGPRDFIAKNPGTDLHRDNGVASDPSMFQLLEQLLEAYNKLVGLPEVLLGVVPSRQPVQTTMMQQQSGEVRTRERCRRIEEGLEDLGYIWLDIVSNHWNDKRTIRSQNSVAGFDMFQLSKKDLAGWQFDIHVRPGSTTPLDVATSIQRATDLLNMGIPIPPDYFVKLSGLPGLESSINEFQSQTAQAQAMGTTPPTPAIPGGGPAPPLPNQGPQPEVPNSAFGSIPQTPAAVGG